MISEKLSTDSRRMLQNGVPQFVGVCRCTLCRQRRGKEVYVAAHIRAAHDAPCAGSAEAKKDEPCPGLDHADAPCAGSAEAKDDGYYGNHGILRCTPRRQRRGKGVVTHILGLSVKDAPRAGSAEAKTVMFWVTDAVHPMHPVQAAQSKITTCRPMVF